MATETKKAFKDDKKYCDKQEKIFEAIDKFNLEEKLNEYFIVHDKTKQEELYKYIKWGNGRFTGLHWRELKFSKKYMETEEYKKTFSPYTGVQVYLYAVEKEDIGKDLEKVFDKNCQINNNNDKNKLRHNEFPYDYDTKYDKGSEDLEYNEKNTIHYLLGKDLQIDMQTGNLIKKDNEFDKAQIWFCQCEKHARLLDKGYKDNELLENYLKEVREIDITNDIEQRKRITNKYIGKYFEEIKNQKLVSEAIHLENWDTKGEDNCKIIVKEIEELLDNSDSV